MSRIDLGAYEASRAAALAGVTLSTLYHWAREDLVPSVSAMRGKLWSYRDLLTFRLVRWLRTDNLEVARPTTKQVRRILNELGDDLWMIDQRRRDVPTIKVTRSGNVIRVAEPAEALSGQRLFKHDAFPPFAPLGAAPDLGIPRAVLGFVAGKVAGEPHLAHSRLTTRDVAGLAQRGLTLADSGSSISVRKQTHYEEIRARGVVAGRLMAQQAALNHPMPWHDRANSSNRLCLLRTSQTRGKSSTPLTAL